MTDHATAIRAMSARVARLTPEGTMECTARHRDRHGTIHTCSLLTDEYGLDPPLANTILGAGIVLSLLSVPLGSVLLG